MLKCTRFFILLIIGFLALSAPGCQSSHGAYGNTKHHNATGNKSAKKKNGKKKESDQSEPNQKNPDETAPPKEKEPSKLGYGCNIGNISLFGTEFQFGFSPNIAYKLEDQLAVGFMIKLDYYYYKDEYLQAKYSAFDVGPTIFTRWKPLMKAEGVTPFMQGLFLQAEYEHASISRPYDEFGNYYGTSGNKILGERRWEDYIYVGLGASSGYPFSTFFSIHYNLLDDFSHTREPWAYRLGFTYNY